MRSARLSFLLLILTLLPSAFLSLHSTARGEETRDDDRAALRVILQQIQEGINKRDLAIILPLLTDEVVVTYQSAEVSHGKKEVEAFFSKFFGGNDPLIKTYRITGDISAPAEFYGDTAVAFGVCSDHMELRGGAVFDLDGKWSSTIVKDDGVWRIAQLHFSTNVLDNSVINGVKKGIWYGAGGGFFAGALLLFGLTRMRKGNRS